MNILLTSVGRRTYMIKFFKEALQNKGKVFASNSVYTYSMEAADAYVITPLIYDNTYISFLLEYCKKNFITTIISLFDIDLPVLSKNKNLFKENGITLIVSDFNITEMCNDKWLTYKFLKSNQFNVPITYIEKYKFIEDLNSNKINFPVVIKPRWGMASIGIFIAENINEFEVLYLKSKKEIFNCYLKYESNIDPEKSVIIQQKLNGHEYGLDIFNDLDGNFITCVPKIKLAMRAGETDIAEIINDAKLLKLGEKLSKIIKHIGNLDVDCYKVDDEYYILEMNCRFGGQYPFSHLAGVNFPKALIYLLENKKIPNDCLTINFGTKGYKDLLPVKIN